MRTISLLLPVFALDDFFILPLTFGAGSSSLFEESPFMIWEATSDMTFFSNKLEQLDTKSFFIPGIFFSIKLKIKEIRNKQPSILIPFTKSSSSEDLVMLEDDS